MNFLKDLYTDLKKIGILLDKTWYFLHLFMRMKAAMCIDWWIQLASENIFFHYQIDKKSFNIMSACHSKIWLSSHLTIKTKSSKLSNSQSLLNFTKEKNNKKNLTFYIL